ncbi:glycosyltransferase family 2 protein [Actinomadura chokoriensis]|uniref:glycosyltransferase family 2 protein n=1 Tax=Actinomadura chokoriensis TaxID=454156 RepID=UPI0031F91206
MTSPKVSVVVPVYNCRSSVGRALRSVFEQTLAGGLVEVIAVDDGSTDGSGEELDRIAAGRAGVAVVRQPNSGGPGGPRNTGIKRASGEYLFFLDADDHLGPEALERMCAMADEQRTDVVIGNYVGVGRGVARFDTTIPRISVDDPKTDVYGRSLTAHKLFRRDMVVEHGIRFPEGVLSGEDKVFAAHAFLHASGVSVLADYDCYYLVERDDGSSIMQGGGAPAGAYFAEAARPLLEQVVSHREPGEVRDRMLVRHFQRDVLHRFNGRFLAASEDERRETREAVRALCEEYLTSSVLMRMPPRHRLLAHCVLGDHRRLLVEIIKAALGPEPVPVVVDKDRAFSLFPGFRDPSAAVPDAYFDVTDRLRVRRSVTALGWDGDRLRVGGTALLSMVDAADQSVAAVLMRSKTSGGEHRLEVARDAGFAVDIAAGSMPSGTWDLHVEVASDHLVKEARLGADRVPEIDTAPPARFVTSGMGGAAVTPFFTREYGNLSFTVVPGPGGLRRLLRFDSLGWDESGRLRVSGHVAATRSASARVQFAIGLDRRGGGGSRRGDVETLAGADRLEFTAVVDPRGLGAGRWDAWMELAVGGETSRIRVPMAEPSSAVPGVRRTSFYRTGGGNLAVQVVPRRVSGMIKRRLGRTG